ncbi:TetR/AcrR family transcriptional regulator [Actinocorallia sp. B10E7]|uniref:TetR/AcrR family transcriptional regulator n=1 Tax=Actinocorallia sp. B10E7 TaxID=3153558 RepID=UPI00325E8A26
MGDAEAERLIDVAERLFAELGFDGTPLQLIADTAGVDVETLVAQVGDKARIYRTVMRRAHQAERAALAEAVAAFIPTRQGVIALTDAYLDFHVQHPRLLCLWMQRWMGDAADLPGPEENVRTLSAMIVDTVRDVMAPGVDPEYMIWTVVWCVFGFLSGGLQHPGPSSYYARGAPLTPESLADFRAYLHTLVTYLTAPPDNEETR